MKTYRVIENRHGPAGDLHGFREIVRRACTGDIRTRPGDCTGRRFLVRDGCEARFEALAHRYDLTAEVDEREAFPSREARPKEAVAR